MSPKAWFEACVSSLAYSFAQERSVDGVHAAPYNDVARFLIGQCRRMADYAKPPLILLTLLFDLAGLARGAVLFHRQPHPGRWRQIEAWRRSRAPLFRELMRFYESLAVYALYARRDGRESWSRFPLDDS